MVARDSGITDTEQALTEAAGGGLSERATQQVKDIARVFGSNYGSQPPELTQQESSRFSRAVRNLTNAWRAVRGEGVTSIQERFYQGNLDSTLGIMTAWSCQADNGPPYGTMYRNKWLHDFVFSEDAEPILNGAVHTFTAKVQTMNFFLEGPEELLEDSVDILEHADVDGWTKYLGRWVNHYCALDIGGLAEIGWEDDSIPGLEIPGGVYMLDGTRCWVTKNYDRPFVYYDPDDNNERKALRKNSVMQLLSMPNPNQEYRGLGLSPVSRALRTAKLLDTLHKYESERLSNLPPEGIATVTGMTKDEVKLAMELYQEKRESKKQLTFPGVLWLVASKMPFAQVQRDINVKLTPFSSLPEYFDKKTTIELFVKTLAIVFGVDVAEFWQIESHGATKAQATIQAQKAKGKGIGLILSQIERQINQKLLPEGVTFRFEVQDDEDDYVAAEIRGKKIKNVTELYYGKPQTAEIPQAPLISWEEARHLLVREGVLPKEFVEGMGYEPLEPSAVFRMYSHKLKGYVPRPEQNPFPRTPEGMAYYVKMLRDELSESIGESLAHRPAS